MVVTVVDINPQAMVTLLAIPVAKEKEVADMEVLTQVELTVVVTNPLQLAEVMEVIIMLPR